MINYQNPSSEVSLPCYIDNLSSVTVRLTDDDSIELSLPPNAYVSIQLLVDTRRRREYLPPNVRLQPCANNVHGLPVNYCFLQLVENRGPIIADRGRTRSNFHTH
jgi:hypothetical protein